MKTFLDTQNHPHELPEGGTVHWRIAGHAFVVNDRDEILVIVPTHRPQYDLPGGRVELDESIPEGVARECYEETGYHVALDSPIPFFVSETYFYSIGSDKFYHVINMYFQCSLVSEEQNTSVINSVIKDEIEKVEWKKLEQISADNCHKRSYDAIEYFVSSHR